MGLKLHGSLSPGIQMSQPDDLNESELRSVVAAIPAMVFVIGADRRIRFASRVGEQFTHDEVVGSPVLDSVDPGFHDADLEVVEGVFETGEAAKYEIPVEDSTGEREWDAGTLTPLWKDGRVSSVVAVDTAVTARRRAEEEADKLRTLVPVCSWCRKSVEIMDIGEGWRSRSRKRASPG